MAQSNESNLSTNLEHYDHLYGGIDGNALVSKVQWLDVFLEDAIKTDTSWHGLYHGGFANRLAHARVLELGCGEGLNALVMALRGAHVVANDLSHETERILSDASAKLGLTNIEVVVGNLSHLSFEAGSFDFVVGKAFLHHLTHELEDSYLSRIVHLLKPGGEARFVEPATNSVVLDTLRWAIPIGERPSTLSRERFLKWKETDPHPDRDNSSAHFRDVGNKFFAQVDIVPFGSLERLCRLLPPGRFNRQFRRWAHKVETYLPAWLRFKAARSQLIVFRHPRNREERSRSVA